MAGPSPAEQLEVAIGEFAPEVAALGRGVLERMRALLPGMVEMVYDNRNYLVVGFSPTDRPSDAAFSVVLAPKRVSLVFIHGARLDDPEGLLRGAGNQVRNIPLPSADALDAPAVRALMAQELAGAPPWDRSRPSRLEVRAVSANRRPRR